MWQWKKSRALLQAWTQLLMQPDAGIHQAAPGATAASNLPSSTLISNLCHRYTLIHWVYTRGKFSDFSEQELTWQVLNMHLNPIPSVPDSPGQGMVGEILSFNQLLRWSGAVVLWSTYWGPLLKWGGLSVWIFRSGDLRLHAGFLSYSLLSTQFLCLKNGRQYTLLVRFFHVRMRAPVTTCLV